MKEYKRLTFKRLVDPYDDDCEESENASAASYEEILDRLAELEDKIEDGKLFFVPQNQDELLWVSSLLIIWSFGDEVKNERLKEIYKELMKIKAEVVGNIHDNPELLGEQK